MSDGLAQAHAAMKFAAPDPGAAASWYEQVLGFRKTVFENGNYAIVGRGKLVIHLWMCPDRHIAENTSCYVEVENCSVLNALHSEWKEKDFRAGRLEDAPKDQPGHGMREFHVWDPAGNLIAFGAALGA